MSIFGGGNGELAALQAESLKLDIMTKRRALGLEEGEDAVARWVPWSCVVGAAQVYVICGRTGSGKSVTARVLGNSLSEVKDRNGATRPLGHLSGDPDGEGVEWQDLGAVPDGGVVVCHEVGLALYGQRGARKPAEWLTETLARIRHRDLRLVLCVQHSRQLPSEFLNVDMAIAWGFKRMGRIARKRTREEFEEMVEEWSRLAALIPRHKGTTGWFVDDHGWAWSQNREFTGCEV